MHRVYNLYTLGAVPRPATVFGIPHSGDSSFYRENKLGDFFIRVGEQHFPGGVGEK